MRARGLECDEAYARGRGAGTQAEQPRGGDVERGRPAGEGVGGDVALLSVFAGGVGADPGEAVEGGAAYLPARRVQFEADGAAEFVDGEVDGAGVGAVGAGVLGGVAPSGGAGGAVEVFFAEGVWSWVSWNE